MGKKLVDQIVTSLGRATWPAAPGTTALGRKTYEIGLDQADGYRGDPKQLAAALRTFMGGDSQAYAFAGVAYVLLAAAPENDGTIDSSTIEQAQQWLEKAQANAPDQIEINFIEALVYVYAQRLDDARMVLDYLWEVDPDFYYLYAAEVAYWQQQNDLEQIVHWCQRASAAAATNPQRLRWRRILADTYFAFAAYDQALPAYREAIHVDPQNPELWTQVARIHWQMDNDEETERAIHQALRCDANYPPAHEIAAALQEKKKKHTTGRLGGLFRR
ncbi:MAG: tetratricopeptide repeat protein [Anaerolineae bacterium]|nr:tetratricopeptide repeat protein [Anaerolineae bacterium]